MGKIFISLIFFVGCSLFSAEYWLKETIYKHGKGHERSIRFSYPIEDLHAPIEEYLSKFKREITYFDVGGMQPIVTKNCKEGFKFTSLLIKDKKSHHPLFFDPNCYDIILESPNLCFDIKNMSEVEFFDVITVFNPLESFREDLINCLESCINLGFLVFIEIPPKVPQSTLFSIENRKKVEEFLLSKGAIILETGLMKKFGIKVAMVKNSKKELKKSHFANKPNPLIQYWVQSDYEKSVFKKIYHERNEMITTPFSPGINLLTFLLVGGIYPSREDLKSEFKKLIYQPHNDFMPHNMILSKYGLKLIDFNDWRCEKVQEVAPSIYCDFSIQKKMMQILGTQDRKFILDEVSKSLK
jgi:hypothetical protein